MIAFVGLVGAACSSRSSSGLPPSPDANPTTTARTPTPAATALAPVLTPPTYYRDIAPILQGRCVQCHYDNSLAPQDLTDPDVARYFAGEISEEVGDSSMPPWPPGPKTPPLLHTPTLTADQIDVFARWSRFGALLGDPDDAAPPLPREVVDIGTTELAFDLGVDYSPIPTADDDYRCFLADSGLIEDRVATGFRVVAGNEAIVHHVAVTVFDAASRDALVALDARTSERAGWPCFAASVPEGLAAVHRVATLGEWDPGVDAVPIPRGTGIPLPAGAVAVVQMHYRVAGGDPDRTRVEVALASNETAGALQLVREARVVDRAFSIAPDTADVDVEIETNVASASVAPFFADGDGFVTAVAARMQLLGVHATLELVNASGVRTLLDLPRWDMHWQGTYRLATPIPIVAGDVLRVRCTYDNTAAHHAEVKDVGPMTTVGPGDTIADEACLGEIGMIDELP